MSTRGFWWVTARMRPVRFAIQKDETILFWHTGGQPALFAEKYTNRIYDLRFDRRKDIAIPSDMEKPKAVKTLKQRDAH
ncbi:MAG: hypothetical protein IT314_17265 [Anaerolineales bacterium]|nr:hypothetical protein [Anaerolineales bacterium]